MRMNRCIACGGTVIDDGACRACGYRPVRIDGFEAYAPELAASTEGFDPAHHALLAEVEAGNFWFKARNLLIVQALRRCADGLHNVLEIGCGTGFVTRAIRDAFPAASLTGSELFVEGLRVASQRLPDAQFIQLDARRLPFVGCFDAIGAFDVIEHIEDDRAVLRQAFEALVPGGTLLLTVPQHPWLWSAQDDIAHHVRRYTRSELAGKVRDAGFRIAFCSSFVSLLLPLVMVSRKMTTEAGVRNDPSREFRMPGWLNGVLFGLMRAEVWLIGRGVRLPAGGSLLMVATKARA